MQRKKKILLFSALFFLVVCFYFMQETYAKYITTSEGKINAKIARWNIKVNETDIKNNASLAQDIIPTFEKSENIAENVIAPTIKGYFDLNIDASAVDVSFTYNILIEENDLISDFIITGYQIGDNPIVNLTDTTEITNDILLDDTNRLQTIRIYFEWYDEDDNKMDNNADTVVTIDNDNLTLNVKLSFTQKK
mgnify:CR=1 FL=1